MGTAASASSSPSPVLLAQWAAAERIGRDDDDDATHGTEGPEKENAQKHNFLL